MSSLNILYVIHNISPNVPESRSEVIEGGSEKFTYALAHGMSAFNVCYILYPNVKNSNEMYLHKISKFRNECIIEFKFISKFHKLYELDKVLDDYKIDVIHYQHLIHSPIEFCLMAKAKKIPQLLTIHDYYYICEEHFLENDKYVTCDIPDNINQCISCLFNKVKVDKKNVIRRREIMKTLLEIMDRVYVPSKSLRSDYFKIYPQINNKMKVYPIGVANIPLLSIPQLDTLHIGIPSYLTYIKGWVPFLNVLRICEKKLPKIKFYIQCDILEPDQEKYLDQFSNVIFASNDFSNVNIIWIPTIAKETYSLIASESILRGLPLLCLKKGALESRFDDKVAYMYGPNINAEDTFNCIKGIYDNLEGLYEKIKYIQTFRNEIPLIDFSIAQYKQQYSEIHQKYIP